MKKIYHLVCLCVILLFASSTNFAQPSLTVTMETYPEECNTGVRRFLALWTIHNPDYDSSSNYLVGVNKDNDIWITTYGFGSWDYFDGGVIDSFDVAGSHIIEFYLIENSAAFYGVLDTFRINTDTICPKLHGALSVGNAANCDNNLLLQVPVKLRLNKNAVPYDTITAIGAYGYYFSAGDYGNDFTLTPINLPTGVQLNCPGSGSYAFQPDTLTTSRYFGLNCVAGAPPDLLVHASGIYRTNSSGYLFIKPGNINCNPGTGTLTLSLDPNFSFSSAMPTASSISGQTVTWNLNNLDLNSEQSIMVYITANSTAVVGNIACSDLTITPLAGDVNPANNTFSFCDTIRSSFDPNDKKVSPSGDITPGTSLTYTINFENLGTDTAFQVRIVDTLSANIDVHSVEMIASSHPVRLGIRKKASVNVMDFDFPDIRLGSKYQPARNKGFVMYKARAKSSLSPGTKVLNTAYIYFDNNEAVVTNTVANNIPGPNAITPVAAVTDIRLFPNPVGDKLFVDNKASRFTLLRIVNALGQTVKIQTLNPGVNIIECADVTAGLYYVSAEGKDGVHTSKISKK